MKKNPGQTEKTKLRLQNALWDIYREKPFERITVREITERAGVNRSTFYAYYRDVYDIREQAEEEILSALSNARRWHGNFLDREHYKKELYLFGEFLMKYQKAIPLLLSDKGDPKFSHRLWDSARESILEGLSGVIGDPGNPMLDYILEYVISCHSGIMLLWFKRGCDVPFDQMAELTYQLMSGGIIPLITNGSNPYDQIADYIVQKIKENL